MARYWETEVPKTITTSKNVIQFYPAAGKLSVSKAPWENDEGKTMQGKTVSYCLTSLCESGADNLKAAREVFSEILELIDERLELI